MWLEIKKHQGFTLIELMIVLSIIGVLASIAIPNYKSYIYKSRAAEIGVFMGAAKTRFMIAYEATGVIPLEIFSDDSVTSMTPDVKDILVFNINLINKAWALTAAEKKAQRQAAAAEKKAKRLTRVAEKWSKRAEKFAKAAEAADAKAKKAAEKAEASGKRSDSAAAKRAADKAKRQAAKAKRVAKKAKTAAERAAKAVAKVDGGAPAPSPTPDDENAAPAGSVDASSLSGYGVIKAYDYELSPDMDMAWVVAELEDNVLPGCDEQNKCYVHLAFKETDEGLQEACGRWSNDASYGRFSMDLLPSNCQEPCVYCKLR
jgi:prepilin-type N-terminal cleavage/methylation domain-containing protein